MTFTYAGDLSTDLDKVRFYIQDTTENSGPKPGGSNFTDEELEGLIDTEGSWQTAAAAGFEVLASVWATYADLAVGPRRESYSQIAERYQEMAQDWRAKHGASGGGAGYRAVTRVDGYSDDEDNLET